MTNRKFAVIEKKTNIVIHIVEVNLYSGEEFSDLDVTRNLGYFFYDCYFIKLEKKYGLVGLEYTYEKNNDSFKPKKPFQSWIYNDKRGVWEAPIMIPKIKDQYFIWDEKNKNWVKL